MSTANRLVRALRQRGVGRLGWIGALLLLYLGLFGAAAVPSLPAFVALLLAGYLAEAVAARKAGPTLELLGRAHFTVAVRLVLRDAALLLLIAQSDRYSQSVVVALAVGVVTLHAGRSVIFLLRGAVRRRRQLPITTRNVDLAALGIPDAPPAYLVHGGNRRWLYLSTPAAAGTVLDLALGRQVLGLVGVVAGLLTAAVVAGALAGHLARLRRLPERAVVIGQIQAALQSRRPEVALYHSGGRSSVFQVNMWLSTLEQLERPAVVILREPENLRRIADTTVPIICIPDGSDLMNFVLPDLAVVLYVANVGKNIHMQQLDGVKHVFVGHGDSDKKSSARPVSRVYDQIWVAGRAGRDRYHRARVGVRDEAIIEVGRPQLAEVTPARTVAPPILTVLYAPTWEGWSADMRLTSLDLLGSRIIEILLSLPRLRVIYKPHPLTGMRSDAVQQAHDAIVAALDAANSRRATDPDWAELLAVSRSAQADATARLAALDREIAGLRGQVVNADLAQYARDHGAPDAERHRRLGSAKAEWDQTFWTSVGDWSHQTVTGANPGLYSCFNQADLLISDISSVVSDFVASGKPYVVTNLDDVDEAAFRAEQTAAGGAYLLGTDCTGLAEIAAAARTPGDALAAQRRQTREYLLGPAEPDALSRFNLAVAALAGRGDTPPAEVEALVGTPTGRKVA